METNFGYIAGNKVVAKSFLHFQEREVGEVKGSEEETLSYFSNRFDLYKNSVDKLLTKIEETPNKGSFLVKVQDLLNNIHSESAIGDFEPLYTSLKAIETEILATIEANRKRNQEVKEDLLTKLNEVLHKAIVPSDLDKVESLKSAWVRVGKASANTEVTLSEKYSEVTSKLTKEFEAISELTEELFATRVEKFQHLINSAKALYDEGEFLKNVNAFKQLQTEVKEVGFIPQKKRETLWIAFSKLGDDFFIKVKDEYKKLKVSKKSNTGELLKAKEGLIEKISSIQNVAINEATKIKNEIKKDYKRIQFIASSQSKKLDTKFYDLCSYIDERSFVESLFSKKIKNDLSDELATKQKVKILNQLIKKDLENLNNYEDNSSIMLVGGQNPFTNVVEKRKRDLNRGVSHKKRILSLLKSETTK